MSQDYEPRKRGLDSTAEAGMAIAYSLDQIALRLESIDARLDALVEALRSLDRNH